MPNSIPESLRDLPYFTRMIAHNCPRLYTNVTALNLDPQTLNDYCYTVCVMAANAKTTWANVEESALVSLRIARRTHGTLADAVRFTREMLTRDENSLLFDCVESLKP